MTSTPARFLRRARSAITARISGCCCLRAAAVPVGIGGAAGAWVLLKLIAVATNLFWFGRLSAAPAQIAQQLGRAGGAGDPGDRRA